MMIWEKVCIVADETSTNKQAQQHKQNRIENVKATGWKVEELDFSKNGV